MRYCKKCGDKKEPGQACPTCREYARKVRKMDREREERREDIARHKAQKPIKSIVIRIDWHRNYTWGNNPNASATVEYRDGSTGWAEGFKCSGCGYDKESTVIAQIFNVYLKYKLYRKRPGEKPYGITLYKKSERWGLPYYDGGIGTSCYYAISDYIGGKFEHIDSGKTYDVYKYTDRRKPGRKLPPESNPLGGLGALMALGSLMADSQEQKNKNMKAAAQAQPGLSFPADWDTLPEDEKTRRLEAVKKLALNK